MNKFITTCVKKSYHIWSVPKFNGILQALNHKVAKKIWLFFKIRDNEIGKGNDFLKKIEDL